MKTNVHVEWEINRDEPRLFSSALHVQFNGLSSNEHSPREIGPVDHFHARSSGIVREGLVVLEKVRAVTSDENSSIDLEMIVRMTEVFSYADESIDESVRIPMI